MRVGVLLVEDNRETQQMCKALFEALGYLVIMPKHADELYTLLTMHTYHILVADITACVYEQFTVFELASSLHVHIPLQIGTGYASWDSIARLAKTPVQAYIRKPLMPSEVLHAIQYCEENLLKTAYPQNPTDANRSLCEVQVSFSADTADASQTGIIHIADLRIDRMQRRVFRGNDDIAVSDGEFRLLDCLANQLNRAVSYNELAANVIDYGCSYGEARDLLKTRVWALRRKIEIDPQVPRYLVNVRGAGYRLQVPAT